MPTWPHPSAWFALRRQFLEVRGKRGGVSSSLLREPFLRAEELDVARGALDRDADREDAGLDEEGTVPVLPLLPVPAGDVELSARGLEVLHVEEPAREPDASRGLQSFELQDPFRPARELRREERVERPRVSGGHRGLRREPLVDPPREDIEPSPPVPYVVGRARRDDVGQRDLAARDLHVVVFDVPAGDLPAAGRRSPQRSVRVAEGSARELEVRAAAGNAVIEPDLGI